MKYPRDFIEYRFPSRDKDQHYLYHLMDDAENILYIGCTVDIHSRVAVHKAEKTIPFKKCRYFLCDKKQRRNIEAMEIFEYMPEYNRSFPKNDIFMKIPKEWENDFVEVTDSNKQQKSESSIYVKYDRMHIKDFVNYSKRKLEIYRDEEKN